MYGAHRLIDPLVDGSHKDAQLPSSAFEKDRLSDKVQRPYRAGRSDQAFLSYHLSRLSDPHKYLAQFISQPPEFSLKFSARRRTTY